VVDELFTTTANVDTCAIIYDRDTDFGSVAVVYPPVSDPNKAYTGTAAPKPED